MLGITDPAWTKSMKIRSSVGRLGIGQDCFLKLSESYPRAEFVAGLPFHMIAYVCP